jgi:glycosyltransferase involved in cell wall biosynthesis
LAASAVVLLPFAHAESLDAVAEAMAYEAVPIVGEAGGGAELVEHGRSGLVVPADDAKAWAGAILRLYNDRETCRELGRNARLRIAKESTVRKSALRMLALYRELAAAR